jgi:hypothetical protein
MFSLSASGKTNTPYALHFQGYPKNWKAYPYGAMTGYPYAPLGPMVFEHRHTWHGIINVCKKFTKATDPKSPKQLGARVRYIDAYAAWRGLPAAEKKAYDDLKYPRRMSGWNRFVKYYIKENPAVPLYWEDLEKSASDSAKIADITYQNAKTQLINAIYGIITSSNIIAFWIFDSITGTNISDRGLKLHDLTVTPDISDLDIGDKALAPFITLTSVSQLFSAGDHADFSFGDGSNDSPFSIIALCKFSSLVGKHVVAKADYTTGATKREYRFGTNSSSKLFFHLTDESSSGVISRSANSAVVPTDEFCVVIATYDGSKSVSGLKIYLDGEQVDDTSSTSGSYGGMEDTAAELKSLVTLATGANGQAFVGDVSVVGLVAEELDAEQIKRINFLLRGYANLDL